MENQRKIILKIYKLVTNSKTSGSAWW